MADKQSRGSIGSLNVKVSVDVSEALTGLKAVQREAKKAVKELRELESSSQALRELEETCAKAGRLDLLKAFNGGGGSR